MSLLRAKVFTKDSYGEEALRILFSRLRSLGIINAHIDVKPAPGLCNAKLSRVIRASCMEFNRVILLIDGDGHPEEARRRQEQHLPKEPELRRRAAIITNTYEIEEWLLHALYNEEPRGTKPSDRLRELTNGWYQKKHLPKLMEKTLSREETLNRLLQHPTVKKLVENLGNP